MLIRNFSRSTSSEFSSLIGTSFTVTATVDETPIVATGGSCSNLTTSCYAGEAHVLMSGVDIVSGHSSVNDGIMMVFDNVGGGEDDLSVSGRRAFFDNDVIVGFPTFTVTFFQLLLIDQNGTVFSTQDLPASIALSDFEFPIFQLTLLKEGGSSSDFIMGEVTSVTITEINTAPQLVCHGFMPPFDKALSLKRNVKRAIPVDIELTDGDAFIITDLDIDAPPVVNVLFAGELSTEVPPDANDLLPLGSANDDNQFRFDPESGKWIYNLGTKQFGAAGSYTVTVASGDTAEYTIDVAGGACSQTFVRH